MRSTRTPAFTQVSGFHKLSVSPGYIIPVWCIILNRARNTLHCNYRSGHLKTEHTESLFLLRHHLRKFPQPHSKQEKWTAGRAWETWTVSTADSVMLCLCSVRNKFINLWNCTILLHMDYIFIMESQFSWTVAFFLKMASQAEDMQYKSAHIHDCSSADTYHS
jgi:hypothetical protein